MSDVVLPKHARVVVIGGGIIGCSTAYHLAQMGWKDIVLLERDQLTSGTTWHAAGLMVTFGSTSETMTEIRKYTRDLYSRLEKETGFSTGFNPIGFIEVASNEDRSSRDFSIIREAPVEVTSCRGISPTPKLAAGAAFSFVFSFSFPLPVCWLGIERSGLLA